VILVKAARGCALWSETCSLSFSRFFRQTPSDSQKLPIVSLVRLCSNTQHPDSSPGLSLFPLALDELIIHHGELNLRTWENQDRRDHDVMPLCQVLELCYVSLTLVFAKLEGNEVDVEEEGGNSKSGSIVLLG